MKTDLFQSCGHCWVFQICWHIESTTFTASSFRIWNSSTGIPSPPLALFVVMLSQAHLTSHSKMSGCRWVITSSWLSGSWGHHKALSWAPWTVQQLSINYLFYTWQCIYFNPSSPYIPPTPCLHTSILYMCLYSYPANRFIGTIFLDSTYMC